tara:strand:+ start:649 stop:1782 length:1134 start_codon:yes stop_codon:yes gene_type:complete
MGLLDNTFDTSQLLEDRRRALATRAAELPSGRGAVALAASGRERINQGVNSMMGIESPEVKNANMLQGILQKHTNIKTSSDAMAAANDLLNGGFTEYAQQMITNATAMRNSEANITNANKVTGTSTDPNIAKKRQQNIDAADWVGKETLKPGYENTLENKKKQLIEMKGEGWMGTDAYAILQKEITNKEENNVAVEKSINTEVKALSVRWGKDANIAQTESALERMEDIIAQYTDADGNLNKNIPGINWAEVNLVARLPGEQGRPAREAIQALAAIKNALLKERSGAAVTESELKRFQTEVQGTFANDEAVFNFIKGLRATLEREKADIRGGFSQKVRDRYFQQSGYYPSITSQSQLDALPSGTIFFDDQGTRRTKT